MFQLTQHKISQQNGVIIISTAMPSEENSLAWAKAFLQQYGLTIIESELGGDYSQHCFEYQQHMYILTISAITQSVWINDTSKNHKKINQLCKLISTAKA